MGAYLPQPQISKNTKQGSGNGLKFCSSQMQGWRKTMQDADIHQVDIGDGNAVFGIFDGHGGHQVSKYVEQIFIKTLLSLDEYKNKNYQKALVQCFRIIDQQIKTQDGQKKLRALRGNDNTNNMSPNQRISSATGCTANVILITKDSYYIANIGDSRSALLTGSKCIQLSQDHKPQSQIESTRIHNAGGQIMMGRVNGGLNLSRSFGDFDYKQSTELDYQKQMITCHPDVQKHPRQKQDKFILMGCDGIWQKYVTNSPGLVDLTNELLSKHGKYNLVIEQLLDTLIAKETKQGVGCDNMTAIIIGFQ